MLPEEMGLYQLVLDLDGASGNSAQLKSTHDLPAMVMRPTADSGFESVFAEKTVDTA